MKCKKCGESYETGDNFCHRCGDDLNKQVVKKKFCRECGKENTSEDNFCHNCGHTLKNPDDNKSSDNRADKVKSQQIRRPREEKFNKDLEGIGYIKESFLKPGKIPETEYKTHPTGPLIFIGIWIVINTFLAVSALRSAVTTYVQDAIAAIEIPELNSGSNFLDDLVNELFNEGVPTFGLEERLIDEIISIINIEALAASILILSILYLIYSFIFLYFIPKDRRTFSKIITDYTSLYVFPLLLTTLSLGLLIILNWLQFPIILLVFSFVISILIPPYLLVRYMRTKNLQGTMIIMYFIYFIGVYIMILATIAYSNAVIIDVITEISDVLTNLI